MFGPPPVAYRQGAFRLPSSSLTTTLASRRTGSAFAMPPVSFSTVPGGPRVVLAPADADLTTTPPVDIAELFAPKGTKGRLKAVDTCFGGT